VRSEPAAVEAVVPLSPLEPALDEGLQPVAYWSMALLSAPGPAAGELPWALQVQVRPSEQLVVASAQRGGPPAVAQHGAA
jgi:hypothetical protein